MRSSVDEVEAARGLMGALILTVALFAVRRRMEGLTSPRVGVQAPLRVSSEEEQVGLDLSQHNEQAYSHE